MIHENIGLSFYHAEECSMAHKQRQNNCFLVVVSLDL